MTIEDLKEKVRKYGEQVATKGLKLTKRSLPFLVAAGISVHAARELIKDAEKNNVESRIRVTRPATQEEQAADIAKYAKKILKLNGKSTKLRFDPLQLVKLADKYNFDKALMLAQMQCETKFGRSGRARWTNSMFSIGAYDHKTVARYSSCNASIEPYIKIMLRDYLDNGKISVDHLLEDGNFVNKAGKRYASNKKYEALLREVRAKIIEEIPSIYNAEENALSFSDYIK